jgi:hypothetical protein
MNTFSFDHKSRHCFTTGLCKTLKRQHGKKAYKGNLSRDGDFCSRFAMRILCAVALSALLSLSCVKAVTFQSPQAQSELTPGTSFQVVWGWDSPPRADDGTLDIYLVRDSAATSVVSQIATGALILYSATSATIPAGTAAGQYYLQLRVTSGTEKSATGGPFNVATGPAVIISNSTTTTVTVGGGGTVTSYVLPTDSPQSGADNSAAPDTQQQRLAGGAIAGIIIGTMIAFVSYTSFDTSQSNLREALGESL